MIRNACMLDIDQIANLEAICFPKSEAAGKDVLTQRIQTFSSSFLVMEEEGTLVGMINGCVCHQHSISDNLYSDVTMHDSQGSYQTVFGLVVHPNYRHKGIAQCLMNEFIQLAKRDNRVGITLTCKEHMISFYEQFGYVNKGMSQSVHGNVIWYDMLLLLQE